VTPAVVLDRARSTATVDGVAYAVADADAPARGRVYSVRDAATGEWIGDLCSAFKRGCSFVYGPDALYEARLALLSAIATAWWKAPVVTLDLDAETATVDGEAFVAHAVRVYPPDGPVRGEIVLAVLCGRGRHERWLGDARADGSVRELPRGGRTSQRAKRWRVVSSIAAAWLAVSP
jgi:hypothetical protein